MGKCYIAVEVNSQAQLQAVNISVEGRWTDPHFFTDAVKWIKATHGLFSYALERLPVYVSFFILIFLTFESVTLSGFYKLTTQAPLNN